MSVLKFFGKITRFFGIHRPAVKIVNHLQEKRTLRLMKKHGFAAIEQIYKVSEAIDAPIFLTFGVLLGAIREHGFISHDLDIDFGMMAAQRPKDFTATMQHFGFQFFEHAHVKIGEEQYLTEESYRFHGLRIDIFYIHEAERGYTVYCYSPQDYVGEAAEEMARIGYPARRYWITPCNFERTNFLGKPVWQPVAAHKWSEEVYGSNYMTPIKNWDVKEHKTTVEHNVGRVFRENF